MEDSAIMETNSCLEELEEAAPSKNPSQENFIQHPQQRNQPPLKNPPRKSQQSAFKWRTFWAAYLQLFGYLILGGGFAVAHHYFYQYLHGTVVSDILGFTQFNTQQLYLQVGTAISWIAQSCFGAAINAAYNQYAWVRMRSKRHTVKALDSIFTGSSNFLSFMKPAFVREAPICWLIAACTLLMPLTSQFTQATLNVAQSSVAINRHVSVPVLNFANTSNYILSDQTQTTRDLLSEAVNINPAFQQIALETISGGKVLPMAVTSPNTTYNLTFRAPGIQCSPPTDQNTNDMIQKAIKNAAPSNTHWSGVVYIGCIIRPPNLTNDMGLLGVQFMGTMLACEHTDFMYQAKFTSTTSFQTITDLSNTKTKGLGRQFDNKVYAANNEYLTKMLNGSWYVAGNRSKDQTTPSLHVKATSNGANFFSPALEYLVMDAINGLHTTLTTVDNIPVKWIEKPYHISQADRALARKLSFEDIVEEVFRNITLSLFSNDEFWSLSRTKTTGAVSTPQTRYVYKRRTLTLTYGVSFILALFWTIVGLLCLLINGISRGMSFSSIVTSTRNKELDELSSNIGLKDAVLPGYMMKNTKLMFGIQDGERVGFGSHVTKFRMGQRIARDLDGEGGGWSNQLADLSE
ncbi:hypothetical protein BGW36DRAFT_442699 [Talaromyces proteolyticus]|uniref:Uncharacterized protein n=1 Tax=Talaromyces proteolyticus TaxID=1131652 RepID=A0AAD4KEA7_9EURO|nr:uncharacterized protein BGW36DRAFT_442699 [Talaromyces proteolyticus]KAH8688767.1 hypothetical protein BGW36DRAFT_442699 [Talaromyces proteolyticus]